MKYRESGMPERGYWKTLFDVYRILDAFAMGPGIGAGAKLG